MEYFGEVYIECLQKKGFSPIGYLFMTPLLHALFSEST